MDWQVTVEPVVEKSADHTSDLPAAKTFPPGADQIVFGRESTADVVFPGRIVGGMHGRLYRQPSGEYAIEAYGKHYIEVNGYPADRGQYVPDGAIIRFGNKTGPAVRVRLKRGPRTDGLLSTLTQASVVPVGRALARMRTTIGIVIVAVAVIAAGVAWLYWTRPTLETELAELRGRIDQQAKARVGDVNSSFLEAVYAVILVGDAGKPEVKGTAWAYRPGMLVTNAHVAGLFDPRRPGTLLLRNKAGRELVVTGTRIHPGYTAHAEYVAEAPAKSSDFKSLTKGRLPSAYDVAILEVDPAADLGPTLEVAPESEIAGLRPGMAIAAGGFPIEKTAQEKLSALSPVPQFQYGFITSMTDYFLFQADQPHAYLIQNSVPATGGASGSPIVDSSGKVVAVLSGGTIAMTSEGRIPSAVMLNYAQRADLIGGVLDPGTFDAAGERSEWDAALERFNQFKDLVMADARRTLAPGHEGAVRELPPITGSLTGRDVTRAALLQYRIHKVDVEAGTTYRFLVYGAEGDSVNLALFRDNEALDREFDGRWFASLTYTADKTESLSLRVVGDAEDPAERYDIYRFTAPAAVAAAVTN